MNSLFSRTCTFRLSSRFECAKQRHQSLRFRVDMNVSRSHTLPKKKGRRPVLGLRTRDHVDIHANDGKGPVGVVRSIACYALMTYLQRFRQLPVVSFVLLVGVLLWVVLQTRARSRPGRGLCHLECAPGSTCCLASDDRDLESCRSGSSTHSQCNHRSGLHGEIGDVCSLYAHKD